MVGIACIGMETIVPPTEKGEFNQNLTFIHPAPLGDKQDVADMLKVSLRTVDNYIANGCPVIKPTPRCCRFDLPEVMAWIKTKYGQQSRKSFSGN